MSTRRPTGSVPADLSKFGEEMRRIFPDETPAARKAARDLRAENQARQDAQLKRRERADAERIDMTEQAAEEYPRVVSLAYRIDSRDGFRYAETAESDGHLREFTFRLCHVEATFVPTRHFAGLEEAKAGLEPQLRAWELLAALQYGPDALRFAYLQARVDEAPPGSGFGGQLSGLTASFIGGHIKATVVNGVYPAPPADFAVDPCVQALGELLLLAKSQPITLLHMAYSMKTCVEHYIPSATQALGISRGVFDEISNLANTRGAGAEVRKYQRSQTLVPLKDEEREWLLRALEYIVRRAGAVAAGALPGRQITVADV